MIYWRIAALAVAFAVGWLVNGWRLGNELRDMTISKQGAELERQAAVTARRNAEDAAIDVLVSAAYEQTRRREAVRETITREVIRYVENESVSGSHCRHDSRWVLLSDAAALGADPETLTGPGVDAAAAAVTHADSLPVITDNYAACRRDQDALSNLQQYVREVCLP